jgi:hypothetical protein
MAQTGVQISGRMIETGFMSVKESASFFEKKAAKKLLLLGALAAPLPTPPISRSFLVLFFKKELLALPYWLPATVE